MNEKLIQLLEKAEQELLGRADIIGLERNAASTLQTARSLLAEADQARGAANRQAPAPKPETLDAKP
jgi:hypothetical protein